MGSAAGVAAGFEADCSADEDDEPVAGAEVVLAGASVDAGASAEVVPVDGVADGVTAGAPTGAAFSLIGCG